MKQRTDLFCPDVDAYSRYGDSFEDGTRLEILITQCEEKRDWLGYMALKGTRTSKDTVYENGLGYLVDDTVKYNDDKKAIPDERTTNEWEIAREMTSRIDKLGGIKKLQAYRLEHYFWKNSEPYLWDRAAAFVAEVDEELQQHMRMVWSDEMIANPQQMEIVLDVVNKVVGKYIDAQIDAMPETDDDRADATAA